MAPRFINPPWAEASNFKRVTPVSAAVALLPARFSRRNGVTLSM